MKNLITKRAILSICVCSILFISSCKKEETFIANDEFEPNSETIIKSDPIPPYLEVETWIYYLDGRFDCVPPASNCTIVIIRPKINNSIGNFIENNVNNDFDSNVKAIQENYNLVSKNISDETLLTEILNGNLFAKFLFDDTGYYFLALKNKENDLNDSNVYSVWKFPK